MRELNCKQTEKPITQFIENDMDHATKWNFLEHVDKCPSCKEELSIQFLVTTGMQRLENGDTFDLNRELRSKMNTERHHLQVLKSLQDGLYATQALSLLLAFLILIMVVL